MRNLFEITEIQKNIVRVYGVGYQADIGSRSRHNHLDDDIDSEGCLVEVRGPGKAIIINKMGQNAVLLENEWEELVKAVKEAIVLAKSE